MKFLIRRLNQTTLMPSSEYDLNVIFVILPLNKIIKPFSYGHSSFKWQGLSCRLENYVKFLFLVFVDFKF